MPEETMILRDAAQRLARTRNPKTNRIQSSKLLSVLRSGDLKAGFYILGGTVWIEIPETYWLGINSSKFRRIARTDDPKSGTYPIRATEFPDQVASIIWSKIGSNEQIAAVIKATARPYEVTIKTKDFLDYLQSPQREGHITTTSVGRKRKEGWRDICSYMGAYMIAHYREGLKAGESAEQIVDLAKADGVEDLPSADTLKEQVSKMIDLLKKPAFKPKK